MTQTQAPPIPRPVPRYPKDDAPYWQHMREHRLHIQRCATCGRVRMYPRPMCDACYSMEYDWVPASGPGKDYSRCVVPHQIDPASKDTVHSYTTQVHRDAGGV